RSAASAPLPPAPEHSGACAARCADPEQYHRSTPVLRSRECRPVVVLAPPAAAVVVVSCHQWWRLATPQPPQRVAPCAPAGLCGRICASPAPRAQELPLAHIYAWL